MCRRERKRETTTFIYKKNIMQIAFSDTVELSDIVLMVVTLFAKFKDVQTYI